MKHLILFALMFFAASSVAQAQTSRPAKAKDIVEALFNACAFSVIGNNDPAEDALKKGYAEFAPEQAAGFSPDGGRVFELPGLSGNAVMMTMRSYPGACSIAVREISPAALFAALDADARIKKSYRLMREKRVEEQALTRRDYQADIKGPLSLLVSASDRPRPGSFQTLITIARVKK